MRRTFAQSRSTPPPSPPPPAPGNRQRHCPRGRSTQRQCAPRFPRRIFFLVLEIGEPDLYEAVMIECAIQTADKPVGEAGVAEFQDGLQNWARALSWRFSRLVRGIRMRKVKRPPGKKKAPLPVSKKRGATLATSYSRTPYRRTTIGAAAFHFRVRNGNGWGHCARITRDLVNLKLDRGGNSLGAYFSQIHQITGDTIILSPIFYIVCKEPADSLISTYRVRFLQLLAEFSKVIKFSGAPPRSKPGRRPEEK